MKIKIFLSLFLSAVLAKAQTVSEEVMKSLYEEVQSPYKYGMVVAPTDNDHKIDCPTIYRSGDRWYMTYVIYNGSDGLNGRGYTTWLAESADLLHWNTLGCLLDYKDSGWDMNQRGGFPSLIDWKWNGSYEMSKYKNRYWMTYLGGEGTGYEGVRAPLFLGQAWTENSNTVAHEWSALDKPLMHINDKDAQWWEKLIQYKSLVYEDSRKTLGARFVMFYNAGGINPANNHKAERIGIALSNDMKKWKRYKGNPVFAQEVPGIITGDAQIADFTDLEGNVSSTKSVTNGENGKKSKTGKISKEPLYVMFYFSAYNPSRKYNAFNTFAVSRDLVNWQKWEGKDLVYPTKGYDEMFAHKSYVLKHNGVVYHFYCAVNNAGQRGIALATSKPMGKSPVSFPLPEKKGKREVISLNNHWTTRLLSANTEVRGEKTLNVNIPHNWDDYYGYRQLKHGNLHGSAIYERSFSVEKKQGKRYFLFFEGVGTFATVTLNGHSFDRQPVGRTTYTLDVTEHLNNGKNSLSVLCDHPELITNMPWVCGGCSSEWGFSEGSQPLGIYRPVSLVVTDEVRIEPFGVHVWNNNSCDTVFINTEVRNYGSGVASFEIVNNFNLASGKRAFRVSEKVSLKPGETRVVSLKSPISNVNRWSLEDPYLYKVVSMIKRDGKTTDQVETPYGIRDIRWVRTQGAPGFFLNGKRTFINGTCDYEHILGGGHAFSPEQITSRMKMISQAGFNAFREAHQPHNLLFQDILDRQGMLFWSQYSAHIWYDTPQFRENFKTLMRQWVKERRNSPSLILWGLQNESTLPKAFAEECSAIIRDMDPTCSSAPDAPGRLITTCNGGEGTDWNVIQNWSGTYGGTALNYDNEMKRPDQLLNGEYGAWRTIGLHSESPLDVLRTEKTYSEERATDLMETKVRLAEQAKDSICGHFQWIFTTHDNPGRVQPDEAYRMVDKIGPTNYKGLTTVWEQPADMFFMYRSNYVSPEKDPMVYINSHTWTDRFKVSGKRRTDISVYSNCDSVRLYNSADESVFLGRKRNARKPGTHMLWENREVKFNVLKAVGYYEGKAVAEDIILLEGLAQAPGFESLYAPSTVVPSPADNNQNLLKPSEDNYVLRLNCGGDRYTDTFGNVWECDDMSFSKSWGDRFANNDTVQNVLDIQRAKASQGEISVPIRGTRDWMLFQSFRFGRHELEYSFPLPNGDYEVELYFAEPWLGIGSGIRADHEGQRLFSVAVNGKRVINDLDIWAEAGYAGALKQTVKAMVTNGKLVISFPETKAGEAIISAIAIKTKGSVPALKAKRNGVWKAIRENRVERLPKEMLPADEEAFPASRYTPQKSLRAKDKSETMFVITPGVAREYALRFRFRNNGAPVKGQLRIIDEKGIVLVNNEILFPSQPKKFKMVSTTTGTQINAGNYHLQLLEPGTKKSIKGVEFEYVEVQ